MIGRFATLTTLGLAACGLTTMFEPTLDPLTTDPLVFEASEVWSVPTEARFPTDLAVLSDGGFAVLDGYRHRALVFNPDRSLAREVPIGAEHGTPVRAARSSQGETWWLTVPDADAILEIGVDGSVVRTVQLSHADGEQATGITAVFQANGELVVGLADGRIAWADPSTGQIQRTLDADVDGAAFGMIVDIAAGAA